MRDLLEKDPSREGVTRETVVLTDLVDLLLTDGMDRGGKRIKLPSVVKHIQGINLHLKNAMNTAESRHYTHAEKALRSLKEDRKKEDEVIDLLIRAVQDERWTINKNTR